MLDKAFSQLNDYFSSRFVLGQFLPVFTILSVNLLLYALYRFGWAASLAYITDTLKIGDFATAVGVIASLSCVIAFTLAPLLDGLRRILEGSLLPDNVRNLLVDANRRWADRQGQEIAAILSYAVVLDQAWRAIDQPLVSKASTPPELDPKPQGWIAKALQLLLEKLDVADDGVASPAASPAVTATSTNLPDPDELTEIADRAVMTMAAILDRAEIAATRSRWDLTIGKHATTDIAAARIALTNAAAAFSDVPSAEFLAVQVRFIAVARRALAVVRRLASDRQSALALQYVQADPRPTRFGNLRAALENYTFTVYGVGFDYLWPRIQLMIAKDDVNAVALTEARTQLEYALTAMLLVMLSFAFWLIALVVSDDRWVRFLLVGVASWLCFHLFYRVCLEAQRTLTEIIKSVIDRYRLDLLRALGASRPANNDAERQQWRNLAIVAAGGRPLPPLTFEAASE